MTQHVGQQEAPVVDLDALLVALVLVPGSYPRNKFFEMFKHPGAHEVRRRAALLRSLVTDLLSDATDVEIERGDEQLTLSYRRPELGVRRTTVLHDTELALVKYAVERVRPRPDLDADEGAVSSIAPLLERLYR